MSQGTDYVAKVAAYQQRESWETEARRLIDHTPIRPLARVLDFGCGTGKFARLLSPRCRVVVGYDVMPEMLAEARKDCPRNVFFLDNIDTTHPYDAIFALHVLGHVPDPRLTLARLYDLLIPGGRLVILNPNKHHTRLRKPVDWLKGYRGDPTLHHHFAVSELTELADIFGFEKIWHYHTGYRWLGTQSLFALFLRKPK